MNPRPADSGIRLSPQDWRSCFRGGSVPWWRSPPRQRSWDAGSRSGARANPTRRRLPQLCRRHLGARRCQQSARLRWSPLAREPDPRRAGPERVRSATIRAISHCDLLALDAADFRRIANDFPQMQAEFRRIAASRRNVGHTPAESGPPRSSSSADPAATDHPDENEHR